MWVQLPCPACEDGTVAIDVYNPDGEPVDAYYYANDCPCVVDAPKRAQLAKRALTQARKRFVARGPMDPDALL